MTNFNDIFAVAQWSQKINSLGINSPISEIMKTQKYFSESLSGFKIMSEIAKSLNPPIMYTNPAIPAMEAISRSFKFQSNFGIPQTTIDAINSINKQHEQLLTGIRAMTEILKFQSPAITQINNLHLALNNISGQFAAIAALQKDWSLIEDFEEITEQALEFTESLDTEFDEEQKRQFQILINLVISFLNKNKKVGVYSLLIIDIFLRFAGVHQYFDFLKEKPELATKMDVNQISITQDSTIFFIKEISKHLKEANEFRVTNRPCFVKLKPQNNTIVLAKLPDNFDVIVIQIHHKWVYVSYFDPIDDLPQTGWIMKKYLDKPE